MSDVSNRILASLLEARTGQQLSMGRRWRIDTALKTVMRERGIATIEQLVGVIVSGRSPALVDEVVDALLNNETFFFRDRATFDLLLDGALRRIERARAQTRRIRIWCAGCSTGQEVYSLAMTFAEDSVRWRDWAIDIVGSDVSVGAVNRAREGLYSQFEVQRGLPVRQMMRWFDEEPAQQWRVSRQLRASVRFLVHNLAEPPPRPGGFDIILCRNVLLYFSKDMQRTVFTRLVEASAPDASLMLGAGETTIGQTEEFVADPEFRGLYMRASTRAVTSAQVRAGGVVRS